MKTGWMAFSLVLALGYPMRGSFQPTAGSESPVSESHRGWVLTWDDEFNGPSGSSPDKARWVVETGGNSWGNHELQYYTPRRENLRQENGNLVMEATKEDFTGSDGVKRHYTSARITTQGRFSQTYGRFEARIKIPFGQGIWPAFWLLGADFSAVGWPRCGEIDVMENSGSKRSTIHGSIHGPGYFDTTAITSAYTLPKGRFSDDFHVFAVEWGPRLIRFYVDDQLYSSRSPADLPKDSPWVYDHPFFLVLNLAVGGNLPGRPDNSTAFPQRMLVDYVRAYSRRKGNIDAVLGVERKYDERGVFTGSGYLLPVLYSFFTPRSVLAFLPDI